MSPTLLTVAGFDPGSGAGVTADLAVMFALGFFGTSAITSLTVQSTVGVRQTHPVAPDLLRSTLDCLAEDLAPAGIKLGMLGTAQNVEAVKGFLLEHAREVPLVLDPVLRSSSGAELLEPAGVAALGRLLDARGVGSGATWMTPNLDELAVLSAHEVREPAAIERAAAELQFRWPHVGLVVTGGHLAVPRDLVLAPGQAPVWLAGELIESRSTHGTGCAFSTAFLCFLVAGAADGSTAFAAARAAKHFVEEGMRRAEPRGAGRGPLDLIWPLRPRLDGNGR